MDTDMENYENEDIEQEPTGCQRVSALLLRFLVVITLGVVLGAGAYYGVPRLYRDFIAPTQENQQRIADLETTLTREKETVGKQISQVGDRLADIEGRLAKQGEDLAGVQAVVEGLRNVQLEHADEISGLETMADSLAGLETDFKEMEDRLGELEVSLSELEIPAGRIGQQLQLIRAMTLLARARVSLLQDNLGLAAADIEAASDVLAEMIDAGTEEDSSILSPILTRLELALEDIRVSPVIAADDLEIAWKLLVEATSPETGGVQSDPGDMILEEGSNETE
ncbi:MAG: hypothetical protein GTO14_19755 [Anaerolineales bacterium]|nr:hypothetical protein [Anaerolineales bacterium]